MIDFFSDADAYIFSPHVITANLAMDFHVHMCVSIGMMLCDLLLYAFLLLIHYTMYMYKCVLLGKLTDEEWCSEQMLEF